MMSKQSGSAAILYGRAEDDAFRHCGYVDIELSSSTVDSDEAFAFQMQNDLLGRFLG
jgi:hypothetical protein